MKTLAFLCFSFLNLRYTLGSFPSDSLGITSVDDVYEHLWEISIDIAEETIKLDFLQEMQAGTLDAERYISFILQDINYILAVTDMLKSMCEKPIVPVDLQEFIKGRHDSYQKYLVDLLKQYNLGNNPAIEPTTAMQKYLYTYTTLMDDPLRFAVGLLPCARLWVWLANGLDVAQNNAYYKWKVENMDGHPERHYRDLLNKYLNTPEKIQDAVNIFREQMQNEHDFFDSS